MKNILTIRGQTLRKAGIMSAFGLILLSAAILWPLYHHSQITEATTGTATASATSLTLTSGATAGVDLTVMNENGTFATSTDAKKATFTVTTTNSSGYTLKMLDKKATASSVLTNSTNSSYTLKSITNTLDAGTFDTATWNGYWGYMPNYYNSQPNTSYLPAPTSTGDTLRVTSGANSSADSYNIAIGARALYTQAAGTYTGTYTLVAVGNNISYSIEYSKGSYSETTNMPSTQSSSTSATSITLSTQTPARTGYTFTGWCMGTISTSNYVDSCTGTGSKTFAAGGSFGIDQTTTNTTTLYAMWTPKTYTVNLNGNNATTAGSTSTTATYMKNTLAAITAPQRKYSITTFSTGYNNAGNATVTYNSTASNNCTSASACTYTYGFNGWYTAASGGTKVASNAATPALQASVSGYTDSNNRWTRDNSTAATLYAQWATGSTTLPTITKSGYTCGWGLSSNTTTITYSPGATVTTTNAFTGNTALYGVCTANTYTLTLTNSNSPTTDGSTVARVTYNANTLYGGASGTSAVSKPTKARTMTFDTNGTGATAGKTSDTYTWTFNGWYTAASGGTKVIDNAATPALVASAGSYTNSSKQWIYAGTATLHTQFSSVNYTMPSLSKSSCTWNTKNDGTGISYTPGTAYNLALTADTTYYAKCVTTITIANGSTTKMQDVSSKANGGCPSTLTTGAAYQLTDSRDNNVYYVARLADGNCWMLENLRLGTGVQLTSSNSNVSSTWTTPSSSTTSGFSSYTAAQINTASMNNTQSYGSGSGKIGVYYNYCAASAGTVCMSSNSGTSASYDICPKGWRMPTGGSSGEYQALYTAYSSNATNFKNALRTPLSGYFYSSSAYGQGSYGYFWSSTYGDSIGMYGLYVDASNVYPADYGGRNSGYSVRCVLK